MLCGSQEYDLFKITPGYIGVVEIFWHDWSDSQLHTTSERGSQLSGDNWIFSHNKQEETKVLLRENSNWGKTRGEGREFTIVFQGYSGSTKYYSLYHFSGLLLLMDLHVHKYPVAL